jgi:membrane protein YqaA with SNARE-associated domain
MIENLFTWTVHWAQTPYGTLALFLLAFAESSFFPIPPDVLMISLALINPVLSLFYALVTLAGSVLGGMLGYLLGIRGGKPLLERFFKKDRIELVHNYFQKYEAWAIVIAGFTPIPYKVFTLAAGVFYVNFKTFVLASVVGRGGRFFLVGLCILFFGEEIKGFLYKYFDIISIVFVVLLIGGFFILKRLPVFHLQKKPESIK